MIKRTTTKVIPYNGGVVYPKHFYTNCVNCRRLSPSVVFQRKKRPYFEDFPPTLNVCRNGDLVIQQSEGHIMNVNRSLKCKICKITNNTSNGNY